MSGKKVLFKGKDGIFVVDYMYGKIEYRTLLYHVHKVVEHKDDYTFYHKTDDGEKKIYIVSKSYVCSIAQENKESIQHFTMDRFFLEQQKWSYTTFGPPEHRGPNGPLEHLKLEAEEALNTLGTEKTKEIVDCFFLAIDAAHRHGLCLDDLIEKAFEKLKENKKRDWPDWRTMDPNKAIEHIRE